MWEYYLLILFGLGIVFFIIALAALSWAAKRGHFKNLDEQANLVFTDDEPAGYQTDYFPGERKKLNNAYKAK